MSQDELWHYLLEKKAAITRPFDRDFVWITKSDFVPVNEYFVKEFNLLHQGKSFRSHGWLSHIHAVDEGEYVFVHKDVGNLARFFPLGIIHLIMDVIPYIIFTRVKGVTIESITTFPK